MSKKITDIREAVSFEGLVALGVDTTKNESVQVPLQFVKQGADAAIAAAQSATAATQAAATATSNANTATTAANTAAGLATTAAQMANIEALANAAQNAAANANTATANTNTAIKAALDAATDATAAVGTIDNRIATKLDTPTANAASVAAISSLVGQTSTGASTKVSPLQLRELVGVDHSLLTEQIVPGEFWADFDGVRRQVYTRTFAGTLAITEGYHRVSLLLTGSHTPTPIDMFGYVLVGHWNDEVTVPNRLIHAMVWGLYGISLEFDPSLLGKQYRVTVKYIKR